MNRNRAHQEREDSYENIVRCAQQRGGPPSRANNGIPMNPNLLNPQYQNPVDLLRNYNRNGRINEPEEENIYERLDNDEDDEGDDGPGNDGEEGDGDDQRVEVSRNENPANPQLEVNNVEDHTYERIDNRPWYRGGLNNRNPNETHSSANLPSPNIWNFIEPSASHYDHPRHFYAKTMNQPSLSRLGRLGRNCFSSENIASATSATTRRYIYQLGHSRMCQSCARFPFAHRDPRYACHYCNAFHERLRYYENSNSSSQLGNSRHYIYQVTRNSRCPLCPGDFHYTRFPMNAGRLVESFHRECHCRNPGYCTCRGRIISSSNSAIYIGRIDRLGLVQTVNNPLYSSPTIYIGRIDRSCTSGLSNTSGPNPSTSSATSSANNPQPTPGTSGFTNEPGPSGTQRGVGLNPNGTSGGSSVCSIAGNLERQHVCDDSCIRTQAGNLTGLCQYLGRNERPDCHHGRVSFYWWFVNRWLPSWGAQQQSNDRGPSNVEQQQPRIDETREHQESDAEESRD